MKSYERLYTIWNAMIQRCTNPKNPQYDNYGGRGISVCPQWLPPSSTGYTCFKRDVLAICEAQGLPPESLENNSRGAKSLGDLSLGAISPKSKLTLDRIDNTLGYSPDNVRWVTYQTQNWNTRAQGQRDLPRGVCWREAKGKFQSYVTVEGKYKSLGYSRTLEDALAKRKAWDEVHNVSRNE